jgi:hypothetical protein
MPLLLLALLRPDNHSHRVSGWQVLTHQLERLTMGEALSLNGQRSTFRVVLDSLPDEHDGQSLYDCLTPDEVARSAYLAPGQTVREGEADLTVEATLRVIHHPGAIIGAAVFPGFWEYRLAGALRRE